MQCYSTSFFQKTFTGTLAHTGNWTKEHFAKFIQKYSVEGSWAGGSGAGPGPSCGPCSLCSRWFLAAVTLMDVKKHKQETSTMTETPPAMSM